MCVTFIQSETVKNEQIGLVHIQTFSNIELLSGRGLNKQFLTNQTVKS